MKTKWSPKTPTNSGWYWMKYEGKYVTVICPGHVSVMSNGTVVQSAKNDTWFEGQNHEGPGLKYDGKLDKSVKFGPAIPFPQ